MTRPLRLSLPFALSVVILVTTWLLLGWIGQFDATYLPGFRVLAYVLLGISALFALAANRARDAVIAMAMTLFYFLLLSELQNSTDPARFNLVYFLLSNLSPLSLLLIALLPDRRPRQFWGLTAILIVPVVFALGSRTLDFIISQPADAINSIAHYWQFDAYSIGQLQTYQKLVFATTGLIVVVLMWLFPKREQRHVLIALCVCFVSLNRISELNAPTAMHIAGGLCLLLVLVYSLLIQLNRDELTELKNRRALNNLADIIGSEAFFAVADIDHFKSLNDRYGHDFGDIVLCKVARLLERAGSDWQVYRTGGEEFCLVAQYGEADNVKEQLETLRDRIANHSIPLPGPLKKSAKKTPAENNDKKRSQRKWLKGDGKKKRKTISVTISIGLAKHRIGQPMRETIKRADQQLYRAKKAGRNRLAYEPDL